MKSKTTNFKTIKFRVCFFFPLVVVFLATVQNYSIGLVVT